MRKPQPEIFHLAAHRLQVHPSEVLFVDDRAASLRVLKPLV